MKQEAISWVLRRLTSGDAFKLPLIMGVAKRLGYWDEETELFINEQEAYRTSAALLDELIDLGYVQMTRDNIRGPVFSLSG